MPREIQDITDEAIQKHTILFNEVEIILTLRFLSTISQWIFNVQFGDKSANGIKLSSGVLHIVSRNFPFDFFVVEQDGVDPFRVDDFSEGRCILLLLDDDDMVVIRDAKVPVK